MVEEYTPVNEAPEEKNSKKLWIILSIFLVLLCCLCLAVVGAGFWLWDNGDSLLGITLQTFNNFA